MRFVLPALSLIACIAFTPFVQAQEQQKELLAIPPALKTEHHHLHEALLKAKAEDGEIGLAAAELIAVLGPHFKREEEIALPPLELLDDLAYGPVTAEMKAVLDLTTPLAAEMPRMLEEHAAIKTALEKFHKAAQTANRPEYVEFAEALMLHAQHEEQVLYPAALLVGKVVGSTLGPEIIEE